MNFTQDQVNTIVTEAKDAAYKASMEFFYDKLKGKDQFACGFAWVNVYGVRSNSKLGKWLAAAGFRKDYKPKCLSMWDPAGLPTQSISVKEAGANAYATYLQGLGLTAYGCSRLD